MSWNFGKVSDIGDVISGFAFKSTWFGEGSAKVIRIGDLKDGLIEIDGAVSFDSSQHRVKEQFKIKNGDILMALSGATVGKIAVADSSVEGAYLNQRVAIIRGKKPEHCKYLKHVFSGSLLQKLLMNAGGAAQPNLSPKDLASMEIPLPPLAEQKRIAAILDKADAIRRKRQQAIDLADDFLRAVFLDMFGDPVMNPKGWNVKPLKELLSSIDSGKSPKCESRNADNKEWGVLKLSAVTYGKYQEKENKAFLGRQEDIDKYEVKSGDLLFTRKNTKDLVAAVAYVFETKPKRAMPDLIFRLNVKDADILDKLYLLGLLSNSSQRAEIRNLAGGAAGSMPNISKEKLLNVLVPVPPIELQKKYALIIHKIRESRKKLSVASENDGLLFKSLSQKAFSGEL